MYKLHEMSAMPLLQAYVNGANKTSAESVDRTISGFPSFTLTEVKTMHGPLGYLAFGGIHCADTGKKFGVYVSISVGIFSEAVFESLFYFCLHYYRYNQ